MKILHVMEATVGGTRRHLRDLASAQVAAGDDVSVIASAERDSRVRNDFEELRSLGVEVIELPMVRRISPKLDARHVMNVSAALRRLGPDIVHSHSSKAGVLARAASITTRKGVRIHTPHAFAFVFDGMFSRSARAAFWSIERTLSLTTAAIIAVSHGEARSILKARVASARQVRVVPNGIDPGPIRNARPLTRAELGITDRAPIAAVIGLLNHAKGQDVAIQALQACTHLHLLIVGEGETEAALKATVSQLALADRVHFLGWRDDVSRILATIDFLCIPSRWEAMPYVALEAMACGLPIVATQVDGVSELVQRGVSGLICDTHSAAALGDAFRTMVGLKRESVDAMRRAARETFDRSFGLTSMATQTRAVYDEALSA